MAEKEYTDFLEEIEDLEKGQINKDVDEFVTR
jgi:hypothetical protein